MAGGADDPHGRWRPDPSRCPGGDDGDPRRRGQPGADRRLHRGPAHEGGDRSRAGGDGRRHAGGLHPGRSRQRRRRDRRGGHGRRSRPHDQREHAGRRRGRRRRWRGVQARQPGRVVGVRGRRPARGARRGDRAGAPGGGALRGRGGHRLLLRAPLPPSHAPRGALAARSRHPHGVQHPRPALQPRPRAPLRDRGRRSRHGRPHGRRAAGEGRRACADRPRRRWPRRAHHHRGLDGGGAS